MHPPFGYALFYLRSVAPAKEYVDKISGKLTQPITTGQIYWGAVPFVVIQVIGVAIVLAFPQLVTGNVHALKADTSKIHISVPLPDYDRYQPSDAPSAPGAPDQGDSGDSGPPTSNPYPGQDEPEPPSK
jgi:Tripartite ATP-independent periplasmic transporter, DctM component